MRLKTRVRKLIALPIALVVTLVLGQSYALADGPMFVQSHSDVTHDLSEKMVTTQFTGPVATGDTIVVAIAGFLNNTPSGPPTGVTDSNHNTYTEVVFDPPDPLTGVSSTSIWYAANVVGGADLTVTATFSDVGTFAIAIHEYSGFLAPVAYQAVGASGDSILMSMCAPIQTNESPEILVAAGTIDDILTLTPTAGAGYALRESQNVSDASHQAIFTEDQFASTPGNYPTTLLISAKANWHFVAAGFGDSVVPTNTPFPSATGTPVSGCTVNGTPTPTPTLTPTSTVTQTPSTTPTSTVTQTPTQSMTPMVADTSTPTATKTSTVSRNPFFHVYLPSIDNVSTSPGW